MHTCIQTCFTNKMWQHTSFFELRFAGCLPVQSLLQLRLVTTVSPCIYRAASQKYHIEDIKRDALSDYVWNSQSICTYPLLLSGSEKVVFFKSKNASQSELKSDCTAYHQVFIDLCRTVMRPLDCPFHSIQTRICVYFADTSLCNYTHCTFMCTTA